MDFQLSTYYPIFLFVFMIVVFVVVPILIGAHVIGPRRRTPVKEMPYESGMDPIGSAKQRFDIKFYLIAILFLVFDVELLFLYPWAVASRDSAGIDAAVAAARAAGVGLTRSLVFGEVLLFIGLLAAGFVYAWRRGVFQWR